MSTKNLLSLGFGFFVASNLFAMPKSTLSGWAGQCGDYKVHLASNGTSMSVSWTPDDGYVSGHPVNTSAKGFSYYLLDNGMRDGKFILRTGAKGKPILSHNGDNYACESL